MSLAEEELAALADTILPGDDLFPAASTTGMLPKLRRRLAADIPAIAQALEACGGPVARLGVEDRVRVVEHLEREHKALFERLLRTLYLTYYGTEAAASAIATSGLDYHLTPQPQGYVLPPFDPAQDTPGHGRGHWLRTEEVKPVVLPEGLV